MRKLIAATILALGLAASVASTSAPSFGPPECWFFPPCPRG